VHVRRKFAVAGAAVAVAPLLAVISPASPAGAHGTLSDPPSRIFQCKQENPEQPKSEGCKAAVALGGAAPMYDLNEVSLLDAGGQHQAKIPDGKLCSAGRDKYRGLDITGTKWKATSVRAGARQVTYNATAPHANSDFAFYITKAGFNPNNPLKWSDLEKIADFKDQNPTTFTTWSINLPNRSGRHILYSIWQRKVGSAEAFYTCSDVDFGGGNTGPIDNPDPGPSNPAPGPSTPAPGPSTPAPGPSSPSNPDPGTGGTWKPNTAYALGQTVTYNGTTYKVRQAHTSLTGWEPSNVPALWLPA
jgi:predicted carbohydrate-binding protein with CBM5 and CBM33 domain